MPLSHAAMIRAELKKILLRRRNLLVLAVMLGLALRGVLTGWIRPQVPGLFGVLTVLYGDTLIYAMLAAVVGADALASDLRSGYTALVLSRGVRRSDYLLAKAGAMFLAAAAMAALYNLLILGAAAVLLPWRNALQYPEQLEWYLRFGLDSTDPGPIPDLFMTHPGLNDLLIIVLQSIGTGALATLGLIPSVLGAGTYVAVAFPVLWFLIGLYIEAEGLKFLSPGHYLNVLHAYRWAPPSGKPPSLWFLYWALTVATSTGFALVVGEKREIGWSGRS
jgi:hypothetical protein